MRRFSLLAALLCAATCFAYSLSGTVTDEQHAPLAGVTISVPAIKRGTVSAADGAYLLQNLPAGVYTVEYSLIGYRRETRVVTVSENGAEVDIVLFESPLELAPVTVTATPQPTDALKAPQSVTVLEGRKLERERGQTVIETIRHEPGVQLFSTGAGIAKPVIRGLTSQRVLVVSDGIRQEGQQWGDEHAPEIDAFDVERIEVVRGPSSVLYGSDALGGVVNVVKPEIPASETGDPLFGGRATFNGFSNNAQGAGALSLYGAAGNVGYRGGFGLREAGNTQTPDGELFNSGMKEFTASGLIGLQGSRGSGAIDYSHYDSEVEIHEDPNEDPLATPYQKIVHDRVHVHTNFPLDKVRLELHGGWQRNDRKEFEEAAAGEPVLNLVLNTSTVDVKAHHHNIGPLVGTLGASLMSQKNETLAEEALIPEFDQLNLAGYLFEEYRTGVMNFSAGVRGDLRNLDVHENEELSVTEQTRNYSAVTGTVGAVWQAAERFALAGNLGRGWRAPTAFELFVNGVHEGTVRFEVGDPNLESEQSLNLDFSLRYAEPRANGEITFFRNAIDHYIYLSPTGAADPESGYDIYQHTQADATLIGGELSFEAQAVSFLILRASGDMVRGENDATGNPLPLIPADRVQLGARLIQRNLGKIRNPYLSFGVSIIPDQTRIEQFETETSGYTLVDAGLGGEFSIGSQPITVDVAAENMFDTAYRSHLSRYKAYALDPGRSVSLKVGVPFTVVK